MTKRPNARKSGNTTPQANSSAAQEGPVAVHTESTLQPDIPTVSRSVASEIPWITVAQMVEVDRAMVEDYGIHLLQMMEHAGRHLAHLARVRFLGSGAAGKQIAVLAGPGGNGGGGLVAARRLAAWGADVSVWIATDASRFAEIPRHQLTILHRMGVPVHADEAPPFEACDLILDGVIGYSLSGAPRGRARELIVRANASDASVLSLDVPSGLDSTSGSVAVPTVRATATMTLALPKAGLRNGREAGVVGDLFLADISVPPLLYAQSPLDLAVPDRIFSSGDLVRLP